MRMVFPRIEFYFFLMALTWTRVPCRNATRWQRPLRILYVGQVGYRKGLQYVLEAVTSMSSSQAELTIVGPIVNQEQRSWQCLPRNARYMGKLSRDQLRTRVCESRRIRSPEPS